MKLKTLKKLQLITVSLFILTILTIFISLILIDFYNYHHFGEYWYKNNPNITDWKINGYIIEDNGFLLWKEFGIKYILNHNNINLLYYNYHINNVQKIPQSLLQLQIGIIILIIISPILTFMTITFIFLIIYLKLKFKNNNFWDAIQNCEIINNYYIH